MRRKLNIRFLLYVVSALAVASIGAHFLHGYQQQRTAHRLRELAESAANDEKALAYYAQYLTLAPDDIDAVQKYAEVLDRAPMADRWQVAAKMEQVLRGKPIEHSLRMRLVHNLIELERYADAIDHLKKLQGSWSDKAEVAHTLGWCLDAKKDYRQAADSFAEAIRINPKQFRSYVLLVEVLSDRLNQPEEAAKVLDDLVSADGDNFQAYLLRARFARRLGDEKSARNDIRTAYKLAPHERDVILEAAGVARSAGDKLEAVRLLQDGVQRFPKEPAFYRGLASLKIQMGKTAEAMDHVKDGLRQAPNSNDLAVVLIDLMIDQKQYDGAREKIADLLKSGCAPAMPNYLKARLAVETRQWSQAIGLFESVRRDLGDASEWHGRIYAMMGLCYHRLGKHDLELQAFRKAVEHEPTWLPAVIGLGAAQLREGRIGEASQTLEPLRSVKELPSDYWVLLGRVRLAQQLQLPEAERRLAVVDDALANADPRSADRGLVQAEVLLARRELEMARSILDELARYVPVLIRDGQFDEARRLTDRLDTIEPGSVRVRQLRAAIERAVDK
jgi:tetratricopeptide (TPR) repeat protein